jgi:4-nitrophenyl phosphatase
MMRDGKTRSRLRHVEGFVLDMDGTLVLGDRRNRGLRPLPGAATFIRHLNRKDIPYVLLTNGTARTEHDYLPMLRAIGLPIRDATTMTPASVAAEYFVRRRVRRVLVLGCEGVWKPLADAGIEVRLPSARDSRNVDAVFVGWYRECSMDDIETACHAVWNGARLFTSSMAPFFATADGRSLGTSRAICSSVTGVTRCRVTVLGKPSLEALRCAARRIGIAVTKLAVVGDDPELEVPMAHRGRALAIAVDTGLGRGDGTAAGPARKRPHLRVGGVRELLKIYMDSRK